MVSCTETTDQSPFASKVSLSDSQVASIDASLVNTPSYHQSCAFIKMISMPSSASDFDPSDEFFVKEKAHPLYHYTETRVAISVSGEKEQSGGRLSGTHRKVLFLDMDNCLYPYSSGIGAAVKERILAFCSHVHNMSKEEALFLANKYYTDYGLAIKGLLLHHPGTDPSHYDQFVDGGINIASSLKFHSPEQIHRLVSSIKDRPEVESVWILTNAGMRHTLRTLSFLFGITLVCTSTSKTHNSHIFGLDHKCVSTNNSHERVHNGTKEHPGVHDNFSLLDGVIYCDYSVPNFLCKPQPLLFASALNLAHVKPEHIPVLVDDSIANVYFALKGGWKAVLVSEFASSNELFLVNGHKFMQFISDNGEESSLQFPIIRTIYDLEVVFSYL